MKIPPALRKLFEGLEITYKYKDKEITDKVQFHNGSQHELNKWIALMNTGSHEKYPLIWYVSNGEKEFNNEVTSHVRLILFQITRQEWLNNDREKETYNTVLYPLLEKIKGILQTNPYTFVIGKSLKDKYLVDSEPNYGLNSQTKNDFTSTSIQGSKQVAIDIVDALVVDFELRINTECIINLNN